MIGHFSDIKIQIKGGVIGRTNKLSSTVVFPGRASNEALLGGIGQREYTTK